MLFPYSFLLFDNLFPYSVFSIHDPKLNRKNIYLNKRKKKITKKDVIDSCQINRESLLFPGNHALHLYYTTCLLSFSVILKIPNGRPYRDGGKRKRIIPLKGTLVISVDFRG